MKKRILPLIMFMLITSMGIAQKHTIMVTVPDTVQKCFVAGDFNNWNPLSDTMTRVSVSPKKYSFEFNMVDTSAVKVNYKFLSGPDWAYQQKRGENYVFGKDSNTAVVDSFQAIYHTNQAKNVTIDVLVPAAVYQCNLTGNFNGWDPIANPMTMVDSSANGKEYKLTIHTLDTITLNFKFVAGPGWPYQQTNSANFVYITDGGTVVCDEFQKIFNPHEVGTITINITVPAGTPDVYIIGSWGNSWKLEEAIHATKNADGTYTAVVPDVADIDYKVYNFPDWSYEEAIDAQGNTVPDRHASFVNGPTYNITVAFWKAVHAVPTGVKDPISDTYKMYTINGTIVVEGVTSEVSVFDINGRMMQSVRANGTFVSKSLQPGIYILRVDNKVQKVAVQ
jgi:hypothetical protein